MQLSAGWHMGFFRLGKWRSSDEGGASVPPFMLAAGNPAETRTIDEVRHGARRYFRGSAVSDAAGL